MNIYCLPVRLSISGVGTLPWSVVAVFQWLWQHSGSSEGWLALAVFLFGAEAQFTGICCYHSVSLSLSFDLPQLCCAGG